MAQAAPDIPVDGVSAAQFLALGQQFLRTQGFSNLLGAELTALSPGQCQLELTLKPEHLQQHGFAHGGVLSYLADNALTYAGGTAMAVPVVTSEFKLNYVRPAQGERLIARAQAVAVGKSQTVCRCDIFVVQGGEEKLCALAQGTIVGLGKPGVSASAASADSATASATAATAATP